MRKGVAGCAAHEIKCASTGRHPIWDPPTWRYLLALFVPAEGGPLMKKRLRWNSKALGISFEAQPLIPGSFGLFRVPKVTGALLDYSWAVS